MIAAGYNIIKKYEGLVDGDPDTPGLDPYHDPIGIPTVGWGATYYEDGRRVRMEDASITLDRAQRLLEHIVSKVELTVHRFIHVALNDNEFAALVSFTYNEGSGNLAASTLRMKLNRNDRHKAADEFLKWRRANGMILAGLVRRRAEERELFLS